MDDTPAATRQRILAAAQDLFAGQGYQRTSVREIAERVGVTKAAVHYHFPRKVDLMLLLSEPVWRDFETAVADAERDPKPRWQLVEGWLDVMLRHRELIRMLTHDPSMLLQEDTYLRVLSLAARATRLIAGPDPTLTDQVRAAQALAMLGDPLIYYPDVPAELMRVEILAGVRRLLEDGPAAGSLPPRRRAGRPSALSDQAKQLARQLHAEGRSADEIAERLTVSRATVYRHLAA
ncbi:TetR family transcriptional regulator [Catellatospora sp. NPDC049609]|uniref:TetR family transcriptional regulator n=1 Tax=Catellatospora sp. NPDC049609 TaxID=3155505 RepID=UPI00341D5609